jgi:hypothetical protein
MSLLRRHTDLTNGSQRGFVRNQLALSMRDRSAKSPAPPTLQRGAGNANPIAASRRSALRFHKYRNT